MSRQLTQTQLIERSINKKFRKELWTPFMKAIRDYRLISEGDRIAVCISGGKDSMLMAKLFQELLRHSEVPFEAVYLVMNPGYSPEVLERIRSNSRLLGIPIRMFDTEIFDITVTLKENPCYMCARMRRGNLYHQAQELGCNKIALGHHFNDVIETTVMGMFYGAQIQAMLPRLRSQNFPGMELIRPLYCIHEEDILAWCRYNHLSFIRCACRMTENIAQAGDGVGDSKRQEIKQLISRLRLTHPDIEKCIFNSIHSVCLDTLVGWKTGGEEHSFLERFETPPTSGGDSFSPAVPHSPVN